MRPTAHLRFVERVELMDPGPPATGRAVKVLQQWWASYPDDETDFVLQVNGEWRDIPLEKES